MRKFLLACLFLLFTCYGAMFAQNKTLGVGVTTPNPNAALHVESPTGNQGFILPRLSTAQRLASTFTTALGATDDGLMVYDTDLNTVFIWNGISWQSTGQVAGGIKLTYPYIDTVAAATAGPDLLALKYFSGENKRVLRLENQSMTNASSTLSVYNAGPGFGAYFQVANPATTNSTIYSTTNSNVGGDLAPVAVYGESTGTGSLGGSFRVNNATNTFPALFAETTGTGVSIMAVTSTGFSAIQGEATGGFSNGISGISRSPETGSFAVLGSNSGGGPAGVFSISNTANLSNALESTTLGTGSAGKFIVNNASGVNPSVWAETNSNQPLSAAIYGLNTGTGDAAGVFRINNAASAFPALVAESNGTGRTATFRKTNTTGGQPAVFVDSQGGHGIWADHNGATGYAAIIQTINTTNSNAGMLVESIGTGPSAWILKSTDAVSGDALVVENHVSAGAAGKFTVINATNGGHAISATTAGQGAAGFFEQTDATVWTPAVVARTNGQGAAFNAVSTTASVNANAAEFIVENTTNPRNAVMAVTEGTGSAGNFSNNNASSGAAALFTQTAGTGAALQAQTSTGFAAVYGRRDGATNGNAALFEIVNAANTYPALQVNTSGTGSALNVNHTGATGDAIYADRQGSGGGSAANFRISNSTNTASSMYAATTAAGGTAIGASNEANGVAFAIWSGGIKIATNVVTTSSISTRASAYRITGGGTSFTLDFGPQDGEVFMIVNETGASITIAGVTLVNGEGKTFVVFPGGVIRGF